jgi:hypothetical protein
VALGVGVISARGPPGRTRLYELPPCARLSWCHARLISRVLRPGKETRDDRASAHGPASIGCDPLESSRIGGTLFK